MQEVWKDIYEYEGWYQVSNLGRVRSLDRVVKYSDGRVYEYKGIILSLGNCRGYSFAPLRKNGKAISARVNRLVAIAFIPNPYCLPQVNHKDEDKLNNNCDNLEWCTSKYNSVYGTKKLRHYETYKNNARKFICIENNKTYSSLKECADELNILNTGVSNVLKHRVHKHYGYHFVYIDELEKKVVQC